MDPSVAVNGSTLFAKKMQGAGPTGVFCAILIHPFEAGGFPTFCSINPKPKELLPQELFLVASKLLPKTESASISAYRMRKPLLATAVLFLSVIAILMDEFPGTCVMVCVRVQMPSLVERITLTTVAVGCVVMGAPQFPVSPKSA